MWLDFISFITVIRCSRNTFDYSPLPERYRIQKPVTIPQKTQLWTVVKALQRSARLPVLHLQSTRKRSAGETTNVPPHFLIHFLSSPSHNLCACGFFSFSVPTCGWSHTITVSSSFHLLSWKLYTRTDRKMCVLNVHNSSAIRSHYCSLCKWTKWHDKSTKSFMQKLSLVCKFFCELL